MAGDELRIARQVDAGFRLQHPHRGERHRHQRRLGILGQGEGLGRSLEDDGAELGAERRIDFIEHLPRGRESLGQRLAHADRLTALARKNKSDRHCPVNLY